MDVGNFLQLERAFERDRVVDAAAEEEEVRATRNMLGEFFALLRRESGLLQLAGNAQSVRWTCGLRLLRSQRAAHLAEVQREADRAR